jgi:hypothetical protein
LPAEESIVILGGALARFVLLALEDKSFGVRFPVAGVPGVVEGLLVWFLLWSIIACCCALIASASTNCFRESGSVVARGGRPGDNIARPMFLFVEEERSMGAGLRLSGEVEIDGGGGEVGSSFIRLLY